MAANEEKFLEKYKYKVLNTLFLLIENDTNSRKRIEKEFHQLRCEWRCHALFNIMSDINHRKACREMSIRVLEACLTVHSFKLVYSALSLSAREEILNNLVSCTNVAVSPTFCKYWGEIVVQVVEYLSDNEENYKWPALSALLLNWSTHPCVHTVHTCMQTFANVLFIFNAYDIPIFLNNCKKSIENFLTKRNDLTVRRAAALAVFDFMQLMSIHSNLIDTVAAQFSDLLPKLLVIVKGTAELGESRKLFQYLLRTIKVCSKFFSNHLRATLLLGFKVLTSLHLEAIWNYLALEIIVSITEIFTPVVEDRYFAELLYLVPILMDMAEIIEDDYEDWQHRDEYFEEDIFEPRKVALSSFHRLFRVLGEKIMLQPLLQIITAKKYRTTWKGVHTIIGVVTTIVQSFQIQHAPPRSEQFAYSLMYYLQHEHPRLRYSTCDLIIALGSRSEIIESKFFQSRLFPMLKDIIRHEKIPRVLFKVMQTMRLVIEEAPIDVISAFADEYVRIIEKLIKKFTTNLMLEGKKLILEGLLGTLSAFASKCNKSIHSNYKPTLDIILLIFKKAADNRMCSLLGACLECMGKLISTVNHKIPKNDVELILEVLVNTMTRSNFIIYDIEIIKLMSALTDICGVMGKRFKKYLPTIMRCISDWDIIGPIEEILSKMSDFDFNLDLDDVIELKLTACRMFIVFGTVLKADFVPYAEQIIPMVHSLFSCDYYAADMFVYLSLPKLLRCYREEDITLAMDIWIRMQDEILNFLIKKNDLRLQLRLLPNLSLCFSILQNSSHQGIAFQTLIDLVDSKITFYINKTIDPLFRSNCTRHIKNMPTTDSVVIQNIIPPCLNLLRALFRTYGSNVLEKFEQLNPHFNVIFKSERNPNDTRFILEVYMDAIKCCSHKCLPYICLFTDIIPGYVKGECPAIVRQGAIIACGVIAQFVGESVAQQCKTYMGLLLCIITARNRLSDEEEALNLFDNAMGSIARILKFNCSALPYAKQAFNCWFSKMPILQEQIECEFCINFICDLLDAKHKYVLQSRNIKKLFKIFAEMFRYSVIEPRSHNGTRMLCFLRYMEEKIEVYAACMASLNFDQQDALRLANSKFNSNTL